MDGIIRNYTFRINSELLEKFHYVSRINGRSANMQILIYVQKTVERYESDNGPIEVRGIKYTPSKKKLINLNTPKNTNRILLHDQ